ncbi:unnamed protein product, partial [Mesorhabditis belari]|uniref:Structural maintenance of chromosomes protein n=1 Tax=Mesorhabditis belari TaxID=2138241 RepID=A0AAF3EDN1_9BILA
MGMLHTLELDNFKSYKGHQVIGPFYQFTAIIGPNGSGKSNLMDAICFVLGERSNNLRVRKLMDLIHGAPINKPVATKCSVTMNYRDDKGEIRKYCRAVHGSTSEFRIDGKVVTPQVYNAEMEEIKIFIKAKNFLVYQGQIEQIAMKNPKERTALFEEISRSCEFQAEYDKLKTDLTKAEEDTQQNMNKRRGIAQEKKEAKMEKDEAEKYQHMKDELEEKQKRMFLFELFHIERQAEEAKEELRAKKVDVNALKEKQENLEDVSTTKQKSLKKATRDYHRLDKESADKEKEVTDQRTRFVQAKQEQLHCQKKHETAKKTLNAAQKMADNFNEQESTLKKKFKQLQKDRASAEEELRSQSQEMDLQLSDTQTNEYNRLRAETVKRSAQFDQKLTEKRMILDTERSTLQYEKGRLKEWEEKVKRKETEIERQKKQVDILEETKHNQASLLQDEKTSLVLIEKQVRDSRDKLETLGIELHEVSKQLSDAHGETQENERSRRRQEAIDNLKRVFPDKVFGRLIELCHPSHKRFNLAVTKVLAKHMNSIVCDTDTTAMDAIQYLKEQRYPQETFLPSNYIEVQPINEKLRELKDPAGVKLVFDVITCTNPAARKALQHACGNALICENSDDAKYLAYGHAGGGERYKAVALDGTLFQQSGIISGGGADLKQKAKKWDENAMRKLKDRRGQLNDEINVINRSKKRENDVDQKRTQIANLVHRMEYTEKELARTRREGTEQLEQQLEVLRSELDSIPPKIEELEEKIEHTRKELEALEKKANAVADEVFAGFCKQLGIPNIRVYEEREMRFQQEREATLKKFDTEMDRVQNELEFLKSEDKSQRLKSEQDKVKKLSTELEALQKREDKEEKSLQRLEKELEDLKMKVLAKKNELDEAEAELGAAKKEAQGAHREVTQAEKTVLGLENEVSRKQHERHRLLHDAKIQQIRLPLSAGSLADIDAEDDEDDDDSQNGAGPSQISQEQLDRETKIRLNYKELPSDLRKVEEEEDVRRAKEKMEVEMADLHKMIGRLAAPNLKANQRMDEVKEKEAEAGNEFENARKKAKKIRTQFEKVKTERYRRFQECFDPVSQKIDEIYKALSRNQSAQAFLGADNMEEPYLEGIQYNCVAPGKRFRPMDNLSGGEKTVAALALLFAMHARNPSPFFVLDEIDAALDNTNIGKVAQFICDTAKNDVQLIVISLKEEFYNKADALVGIFPEPANCTVSGVVTMDLTKFKIGGGGNDTTLLHEHLLVQELLRDQADRFRALEGLSLLVSQLIRIQVPNPGAEFCIHVTLRSVQTGALLGSVLGPISFALFSDGQKFDARQMRNQFISGGMQGALIGAILGPCLTWYSIRNMSTIALYDKCYKLRFNSQQMWLDRTTVISGAVGALSNGSFGFIVGLDLALVFSSLMGKAWS